MCAVGSSSRRPGSPQTQTTLYEADYTADTDIEYYELGVGDLERIAQADPLLMATVYKNVGRSLARQFEAATHEIRALST
jgi:hypothetical protein